MAEELDNIKALWQESKKTSPVPEINPVLLEKYRPKSALHWIKIILSIEFWLSIAFFPFVVYLFMWKHYGKMGVAFYTIITIVYLFYYRFLIKSIKQFNYDFSVLEGLRKVYGYLKFYLLHYKVVIWLSLSIGFVLGMIQGIEQALAGQPIEEEEKFKFWVITIGTAILFIGILGGIMHFLVDLIYGRKIKRLKQMIRSLEDME
jgi:magnesium-transporting ATPase (P-type)